MAAEGGNSTGRGGSGGLGALLARACGRDGSGGPVTPEQREAAFIELMRLVMISIRAGMGRRLRDHRESADVCQSVAKSFVADFEDGKISFETEAQLAAYLQRVVQSKLADLARRDAAAKRGGDGRGGAGARAVSIGPQGSGGGSGVRGGGGSRGGTVDPRAPDAGASADLRSEEARERLLAGLSEDDLVLVRLRRQGLTWEQISAAVGGDAAALRQRFSRIQKRLEG